MFGMGMPEILLILAIALIVIGPRKLPELGRGLGKALREFRQATNEFKSSLNIDDDLGDVRRSLSEMKGDLKSSLSSAAFGDPLKAKETEAEPSAATPLLIIPMSQVWISQSLTVTSSAWLMRTPAPLSLSLCAS